MIKDIRYAVRGLIKRPGFVAIAVITLALGIGAIVVSYDSWQRRFGGDPNLVGKDVLINNHQFQVIGIAPEGFKGTEFVYSPEIWLLASMMEWAEPGATWLDERSTKNFFGIGRLKSGVSPSQAEAVCGRSCKPLRTPLEDVSVFAALVDHLCASSVWRRPESISTLPKSRDRLSGYR